MKQTREQDRAHAESHRFAEKWLKELESKDEEHRGVVYLFTSGDISELFRVLGLRVVLPEFMGVRCAVKRCALDMIHHGEALGYSPDICGYVKADLGLMAGPPEGRSPIGYIPPPDFLVATHGGCFTYIKWFEALGAHFNVPVFVLDVPFVRDDAPSDSDRAYVRKQILELVEFLENRYGKKLDTDALGSALELSRKAIDLWRRVLELGKRKPSPLDAFFEAALLMAPMSLGRGTEECVGYYEALLEETQQKAERGVSPVGEERFRLLFEGPPAWPRFREFWEAFEGWQAVGVASTYSRITCAFDELEDRADPFEFLAELALQSYINWNVGKRRRFLESLAGDYSVDGVVVHSVRSCRPFSVGQLDMRNYLAREAGIPTLFVDTDLADPRYFSSAQIMNRIDTFFESLSRVKEAAQGQHQEA